MSEFRRRLMMQMMNSEKILTIQEAWIDTGYAYWSDYEGNHTEVKFYEDYNFGDFKVPKVSDANVLVSADGMFANLQNITNLDLNGLQIPNATSMNSMFTGSKFYNINLSNFDTSNMTTMNGIFTNCINVEELDLTSFVIDKATNIGVMFGYCSNLRKIIIPNFNPINDSYYCDYFFEKCSSINTIVCKQSFKDYCIRNQDRMRLPSQMRDGGSGTWEIVN